MHPFKKLIIACLMIFCFQNSYAQNTTARFLLWQPSAKAVAMGGTGTAFVDNSFAVYYNPAGLAFVDGIDIIESYAKPFPFFDHTINSLTAISLPVKGFGTFAISSNWFLRDGQLITDETSPEPLGIDQKKWSVFKPRHWDVKISCAALLSNNSAIGASLSYLRIGLSEVGAGAELGNGKASTVLADIGFQAKNILPFTTWTPESSLNVTNGFQVGFAIRNIGYNITYIDKRQESHPPTIAMLGLGFIPMVSKDFSILLSADLEKELFESGSLHYIHLGNELTFSDIISVRTGYFWDTDKYKTSYFTYGLGVHVSHFSVNFARYKRTLQYSWQIDATFSKEL